MEKSSIDRPVMTRRLFSIFVSGSTRNDKYFLFSFPARDSKRKDTIHVDVADREDRFFVLDLFGYARESVGDCDRKIACCTESNGEKKTIFQNRMCYFS